MTFRFLFFFFCTKREIARAVSKIVNYDFPFTKRGKLSSLFFFFLVLLLFFFVSFSPQKEEEVKEERF
jgi:hypothetical protein